MAESVPVSANYMRYRTGTSPFESFHPHHVSLEATAVCVFLRNACIDEHGQISLFALGRQASPRCFESKLDSETEEPLLSNQPDAFQQAGATVISPHQGTKLLRLEKRLLRGAIAP
jgi:hypothetical protein